MLRDLRKHFIDQNNVIADWWRKLKIIRDFSSDANTIDTIQMIKDKSIIRKDTRINILENIDGLEVDVEDATGTKSASKYVINLHFN